jgi:hypothetical protein
MQYYREEEQAAVAHWEHERPCTAEERG